MDEASTPPASLRVSISPPPTRLKRHRTGHLKSKPRDPKKDQITPSLADIEAGKTQNTDHLSHFSTKLAQHILPTSHPQLSIPSLIDLYKRNCHPQGHHFVIHQHDHPIAGPHYDLRLQISETSSVSWAIMYGLPGNPNSRRLNRNATETRVHCLWNHLLETASTQTGSLLIWDTGEYSILPFYSSPTAPTTDDDDEDDPNDTPPNQWSHLTPSQKLHRSFHNRRIRLRLHGARLPPNYTISLRLPSSEDRNEQPARRTRKRKRKDHSAVSKGKVEVETPPGSDVEAFVEDGEVDLNIDNDNDNEMSDDHPRTYGEHNSMNTSNVSTAPAPSLQTQATSASQIAVEEEADEAIRLSNAYPGATNSINSIHQRRWFLSLDRVVSGFVRSSSSSALVDKIAGGGRVSRRWVWGNSEIDNRNGENQDGEQQQRKTNGEKVEGEGEVGFIVRGPLWERSVVTGRRAEDVMRDEGVGEGWVGRGGWRAVEG